MKKALDGLGAAATPPVRAAFERLSKALVQQLLPAEVQAASLASGGPQPAGTGVDSAAPCAYGDAFAKWISSEGWTGGSMQ